MKFAFLSAVLVSVLFVNSASAQYYYVQPGCASGQCPQTYAAPRPAVQYYAPPVTHQQPTYRQPVQATPQAPVKTQPANDYGFTAWLNAYRAAHGLRPVAYDPNLAAWAVENSKRGFGHWISRGRRQNSGVGPFHVVCQMWTQSPGHNSALLDPTVTRCGIGAVGNVFTVNLD